MSESTWEDREINNLRRVIAKLSRDNDKLTAVLREIDAMHYLDIPDLCRCLENHPCPTRRILDRIADTGSTDE